MLWKFLTGRDAPKTRKARRTRLQVETLEDRRTPSTLVALTTANELLTFDSADPTTILSSVSVIGLQDGEDLVGIDVRPADGTLYGVSDQDQFYQINLATGVATPIGSTLAVSLNGRRFGTDFNPVVDRFRLVSDTDQNLRINPNDGTVVDGNALLAGIQGDTDLAYAMGDRFEDFDPAVVASAYTNNFAGATTTTLYGLDASRNTLVRQGGLNVPPGTPSPNGGQLFTVGKLGVNFGTRAGFDIGQNGTAYAALQVGRYSQLYMIDLTSGAATLIDRIGDGGYTIDGLTELIREEIVYAVTAGNRLVTFNAGQPEVILSSAPITGLHMGERLVGIDFRTNGQLFGLGSTGQLYLINQGTGQAIAFGNSFAAQMAPALMGTSFGFDFNHTVDRIRVVSEADQNFRLNPVNGTFVDGDPATAGIQPDTTLAYAMGDAAFGQDPNVVASAYDRFDRDPATPTTLLGIDSARNTLVRQGAVDGNPAGPGGSPNGGQLFTVGSLGVDVTDQVSFDIAGTGVPATGGVSLVAAQIQGDSASTLLTINLATGATQRIGTIGGGEVITAMAIAPPTVQFSAASYSVDEGAGVATITVTRTGGSRGVATVDFSTGDGTATDASDFTPVVRTLTFADGETSKTVVIPLTDDRVREPDERINLTLSNPSGGVTQLGDQSTATLVVLDNDGLPMRRGGRRGR